MPETTVDALLARVDSTPFGTEERALIDEAIALAVETGDELGEYRARLRLNASANMTGDTDALLSSFAWCVGMHDADPARFPVKPDDSPADLLWQYKWMAGTLSADPVFPVEQIDAVLADMEARYRRAGVGLSGVAMARFGSAFANGRLDEAAEAFRVLNATERDDYSHCDACVRSESAAYLTAVGREDEAIALYEEMVEGGYTCGEEPEHALSDALVPYLRAGRLDRAKAFHLRSYRDARGNADNLGIIANHLVFCAITGNEARGLAMLERHLLWFVHDELNRRDRFAALAATGLLLDAVARAGYGDTPVRGAESGELVRVFGAHDGIWNASELAGAAWSAAAAIGAEFDARNGNGHFAERLERTRRLADEHYEVPIASEGFSPVVPVAAEPTDAEGWLRRARDLAGVSDLDGSLAAIARGLETATGRTRARLLAGRVSTLVAAERIEDAASALAERIAALDAVGDAEQAALERRMGLLRFGTAGADDIPTFEAEFARAVADTTAGDLAVTLAMLRSDHGDLAGAAADAETAVERLERAPDAEPPLTNLARLVAAFLRANGEDPASARPLLDAVIGGDADAVQRSDALRLRARLTAGGGDFETALADADAALELDLSLGARELVIEDAQLGASLLDDLGRGDEAVARMRLAVHQAELAESPQLAAIRSGLGHRLGNAGHVDEAIEVLQGVYELQDAQGAPAPARAETLHALGSAFRAAEEYGAAAGSWFTSAELFEEAEAWAGAVAVLLELARLHLDLGYGDDAVELLERAVADARRDPEALGALVDALHLLGRAQCDTGDAAGLETLDEVLRIAVEHEAQWLAADVTDSRARGLAALGRPDEAVRAALESAERFDAVETPVPAGGSMLFAARVLHGAGRHDEAVVIFGQAAERFEGVPEALAAARLGLADALDALGRGAEAAEARRLAEG